MVKQFDEISVDTVLVIKYRLNVIVVVGKRRKKLLRNVRKDYEKLLEFVVYFCLLIECIRGWVGRGGCMGAVFGFPS